MEVDSRVHSLRSISNRRGAVRIHTDALFTTKDALAETWIAGRGPFGLLGLNGFVHRCMSGVSGGKCCKPGACCYCCCKPRLFKNYDDEGHLLHTEKLKRRFDPQVKICAY